MAEYYVCAGMAFSATMHNLKHLTSIASQIEEHVTNRQVRSSP